jgi:enoyl-CoA hydratase/carnithine racemase
MGGIDTSSSNGFHGSHAWARSWTHLRIDRRSAGYCRVTFDHPPINTVTTTTVAELTELVELIEQDDDLNVVVFDSANRDYYLADREVECGSTGVHPWQDVLLDLSRAPAVSIASIRGRARGAGSEFVLACDLRFVSRENAVLGPLEPSAGPVSRAGPRARLLRLVGPGRALEMLLAPGELDGPSAERYGCVNRAIADDELDGEVDEIASRLARCDHEELALTKSYMEPARPGFRPGP